MPLTLTLWWCADLAWRYISAKCWAPAPLKASTALGAGRIPVYSLFDPSTDQNMPQVTEYGPADVSESV